MNQDEIKSKSAALAELYTARANGKTLQYQIASEGDYQWMDHVDKHTEIHREIELSSEPRVVVKEVEMAINEGLHQSLLDGSIPVGVLVSLRDKTLKVLVRGIKREASAGEIEKAILLEMCCHKESEMLYKKAKASS